MAKAKKTDAETTEPVDTARPDESQPAASESTEDTSELDENPPASESAEKVSVGDIPTTEPVETANAQKASSDTTVQNKGEGSEKTGQVRNVAMAGKSVYAVTGKPVEFDADGLATPDSDDLEQLLKVPGYEKV
jgi:hypothetical protein